MLLYQRMVHFHSGILLSKLFETSSSHVALTAQEPCYINLCQSSYLVCPSAKITEMCYWNPFITNGKDLSASNYHSFPAYILLIMHLSCLCFENGIALNTQSSLSTDSTNHRSRIFGRNYRHIKHMYGFPLLFSHKIYYNNFVYDICFY